MLTYEPLAYQVRVVNPGEPIERGRRLEAMPLAVAAFEQALGRYGAALDMEYHTAHGLGVGFERRLGGGGVARQFGW